jgi:cytochrome c oxidase subunit 2
MVAVVTVVGIGASLWLAGTLAARRAQRRRLPTGPEVVHVAIEARQWAWRVRYTGPDGVLGTRDDRVAENEVRVPVGRPVVVHLTTRDVVHGLNLVGYGVFQDVSPRGPTDFWFRADAVGESAMVCSQLCGDRHYQMTGRVVAMEPATWLRWASERSP